MEFEDLQTFVKRRKAKKEREREECKQRKIDHYFKKIKKEKDRHTEVVLYDGDDEADPATEIIVNAVELPQSKAIASSSNKVPSKFKKTSNELSERRETSLDVTSMTNSISNVDMTLMDQIQHAVVHIIPVTENIEERHIQKEKLEEVSESVMQSTEVEYQLASAVQMSRPTVMQDVQAMAFLGKGPYTTDATKSGVMHNSNDPQNSLESSQLNTVDQSVATFAQCERQTMVTNQSSIATQTDLVDFEEAESQTDVRNEHCNSTQTDVTKYEEKKLQTNLPDVKLQEVQTNIKVVAEQIIQTEAVLQRDSEAQTETQTVPQIDAEAQTETETVPQIDAEAQTETETVPQIDAEAQTETETVPQIDAEAQTKNETVPKIDSESQTDLTTENITTVDKIEIVERMESFPTQTEEEELMQMSPFKSDENNADGNFSAGDKSPDQNSTSEVDSNISSASKYDEKLPLTVSAGLDMRVGAYKELTFPPVASGAQKPKQLQPPAQERSPSPIDLCTKPSDGQKKMNERAKRKSSTITVSQNPYEYCRPGKYRRIEDTRISPAHQSPINLSATCSRHLAPVSFVSQSNAILQRSAVANLHQSSVRDLSFKPSRSFGSSPILQAPRPFKFQLATNLDTFANLTLKDRLLSKKISGMSQKRKFDTKSGMSRKSTSEDVPKITEPESKKMKSKIYNKEESQEVPNVKQHKNVNKLELY